MATAVDDQIDLEEPVSGVIVLSRADFERCLRQAFPGTDSNADTGGDIRRRTTFGAPIDDLTAAAAAELAGRANIPGSVGMAARQVDKAGQRFAGNVFGSRSTRKATGSSSPISTS
jgi:hypothetical protein